MERRISYSLMISLKEITLRRLTVIFCNHHDVLDYFIEFDDSWYPLSYSEKVAKNMRKLELPQLLTEQLIYLVEPIHREINYWKMNHMFCLYYYKFLTVHILEQLCWTILGTVDYRKSAEKLIRLEIFDVVDLYKLACLYCLDDYIPVLWEKLPEESKKYYYKEEGPLQLTEPELDFCWAYILKGKGSKLDYMTGNPTTFNQYAFEYSAIRSNKAATEYFFRKLTITEREASLFATAQAVAINKKENVFNSGNLWEIHSDTFIYLLSLLSPGQQMEIFKEYPYDVLRSFLDWPWQDLFLDIAELILPFLTAAEYVLVLRDICCISRANDNITKLFQKFFLDGPCDFRKHFVDQECQFGFSFYTCFRFHDSETIKIIFRNVDSVDRKRLVSSAVVFKRFYKAISRRNWHLVELCLREVTLSKEDKEELKETYFGFLTEIDTENVNRREEIWKQFLHIIDEGKAKVASNRTLDEEDSAYPSTDSDSDSYYDYNYD